MSYAPWSRILLVFVSLPLCVIQALPFLFLASVLWLLSGLLSAIRMLECWETWREIALCPFLFGKFLEKSLSSYISDIKKSICLRSSRVFLKSSLCSSRSAIFLSRMLLSKRRNFPHGPLAHLFIIVILLASHLLEVLVHLRHIWLSIVWPFIWSGSLFMGSIVFAGVPWRVLVLSFWIWSHKWSAILSWFTWWSENVGLALYLIVFLVSTVSR